MLRRCRAKRPEEEREKNDQPAHVRMGRRGCARGGGAREMPRITCPISHARVGKTVFHVYYVRDACACTLAGHYTADRGRADGKIRGRGRGGGPRRVLSTRRYVSFLPFAIHISSPRPVNVRRQSTVVRTHARAHMFMYTYTRMFACV